MSSKTLTQLVNEIRLSFGLAILPETAEEIPATQDQEDALNEALANLRARVYEIRGLDNEADE